MTATRRTLARPSPQRMSRPSRRCPTSNPSRSIVPIAAALIAATLAGCSALPSGESLFGVITPYRIDIVQGNVITREQAAAVRAGMARAQVRDVLGSPLLTDPFHVDRWDYVFTIRRQGSKPQERHVVAYFQGERLDRLDTGGDLPSEQEFVASIDPFRAPSSPPKLTLSDAQVAMLATPPAKAADGSAPAAAAAASAPVPPDRSYPPLEPVR